MADLFISYAREDRDTAAHLAGCLQQHGWSVWWKSRTSCGDSDYEKANRKASSEAHAILVLWSKHSVVNSSVLEEATAGARPQVLIPILMEDGLQPPAEFRHLRAMGLIDWSGDMSDPNYVALERAIAAIARPSLSVLALGGVAIEPSLSTQVAEPGKPRLPMTVYSSTLLAAGAVAVIALAFGPASSPSKKMQSASVANGMSPHVVRIWPDSVQASSVAEQHSPRAAFDGKTETAWISKDTTARSSEWIQASFSKPTYIERAVVLAGYQATSTDGVELFYSSARPRQLRVSTEHYVPGEWARMVVIGEHEREVGIDIGTALTFLRFDAVEIWSPVNSTMGTHQNLAISEIQLYGYSLP